MTIPMGFIRRVLSAGVLVAGLSGGLAHEVRAGDMAPSEDALRQFSDQIHLRAGAIAWRRMLEAQDVSGQCGCGKSSSVPDDINDAWKRAVITAFDVEQFVADFQAAARVALTHADVERFVQAGQTELGRKVLAAQNPELRNRDLETEMRELAVAGQELSVRPARRLALNTLIDLMGGVDSAVDSLSAVSLGIAIGVNAAGPQGGPRLTMDEIEDMTRMQRTETRRFMSGFILPAFGVMFRELTLEELKAQIKLLSRPEWRMATRRFNAVYLVALKAQAHKIGAAFGVELSRQRL